MANARQCDSNLLFILLVVFTPALYAWDMPQVWLGHKSLNTKRLSRHLHSKPVAYSFRDWDSLLRFWDGRRQYARVIKVRCGCGKRIIADAHRDDAKRFIVRADEKLTAFIELE